MSDDMFGHHFLEPSKTFDASVIDSTLVNNYDPANYKLFIGDDIHTDGSHNRDDGTVQHDYDKGFKIIAHDDATTPQEIILTSVATPESNESFTLNAGDELHREGMNNKVFLITSDGTETITELPWLRTGSYAIGIGTSPTTTGEVIEEEEEEEVPVIGIPKEWVDNMEEEEEATTMSNTHKVFIGVALIGGFYVLKKLMEKKPE